MQGIKSRKFDSSNRLDCLESILYDWFMRLRELVRGLAIQSGRDDAELRKLIQERGKVYPAYLRYRELEEIISQKNERLSITSSLMLNAPVLKTKEGDAFAAFKRSRIVEEESESLLPEFKELSDFPLWKVIREIVRQTPEMQIISLEHTLKTFGVLVSRAAIESALETHKDEFNITRQGRKKFVALKGA